MATFLVLIVCSNIVGRTVNFGRRRVDRMVVRGGGLMKQAIFNKSLLQYLACPLSKEPLRYLFLVMLGLESSNLERNLLVYFSL